MPSRASASLKVRGGSRRTTFSPDGSTMYAAETNTGRLYAWTLAGPGKVAEGPMGGTGGTPIAGLHGFQLFDSLGVDSAGNVVVATLVSGCLTVVSPTGEMLDQVMTGDPMTTNVCWGGEGLETAFVTCSATGRLVSIPWERPGLKLNFAP